MMRRISIKKSGWRITVSGLQWKGISRICISSVILSNAEGVQVYCRGTQLIFNLGRLLRTGSFCKALTCFEAEHIRVFTRFGCLQGRESRQGRIQDGGSDIWEAKVYPAVRKLLQTVFSCLPSVRIGSVAWHARLAGATGRLLLQGLSIDQELTGSVDISYGAVSGRLAFFVVINRQDRSLDIAVKDLRMFCKDSVLLESAESRLVFRSELIEKGTRMHFSLALNRTLIMHRAISARPVTIADAGADVIVDMSSSAFEISKESVFTINDIPVAVQVIHHAKEAELLKCSFLFMIDGNSFFQSYPFFNRESMADIQAAGEMIIKVSYMLCMTDLSRYYFTAAVVKNTLQIRDYGSFLSEVGSSDGLFSGESPLTGIQRFRQLPDYIPLEDMPKHLQDVIVLTEDPGFYNHCGVDPHFIGVAATVNLMNKRFSKGASTLTMQLSRNLFLQKEKSISRKIDEMIVAWLLEEHLKLSKDYILEVYLNIIELAEGVYGIKKAAQYYFNKEVAALNLVECITLSYIIPRPKFFLQALLQNSPQLFANLRKHIDYYGHQLYKQDKILPEDLKALKDPVEFDLSVSGNVKLTLQW